jgi:Hint domain
MMDNQQPPAREMLWLDLPDDGAAALRGADQFVVREGPGHEIIDGFCVDAGDRVIFDRYEIQTHADIWSRMHGSGPDTLIRFDDGGSLRLKRLDPDRLKAEHFVCLGGPVQLTAATLVSTGAGVRPVHDVVEGDLLTTVDHGLQPVRQIIRQRRSFQGPDDPSRPVVISFGALGRGRPRRALTVAPYQRVMIEHPVTGSELLIAAGKLVGRAGVQRVRGCVQASFVNLRFDGHELILAEGMATETLLIHRRNRLIAARAPGPQMQPARPIYLKDPAFHPDRLDPRYRIMPPPDVA